jgi:hypothetical protein
MTVGAINTARVSGDITYAPVTLEGYWEVESQGLVLNGQVVSGTSSPAAIDTGTSLWYVPTSVAQAFYTQLQGQSYGSQGYWSIPCNTPTFTFGAQFNGRQFEVDLGDMLLGYADSSREQCVFGIVAQDAQDPNGNNIAIIGDAFLKNVYSIYDYANARVGFANLANVTSSTTTNGTAGGTSIISTSATSVSSSSTSSSALLSTSSASAISGTGFATSVSAFNPPGTTVTASPGASGAGYTNVASAAGLLFAGLLAVLVA